MRQRSQRRSSNAFSAAGDAVRARRSPPPARWRPRCRCRRPRRDAASWRERRRRSGRRVPSTRARQKQRLERPVDDAGLIIQRIMDGPDDWSCEGRDHGLQQGHEPRRIDIVVCRPVFRDKHIHLVARDRVDADLDLVPQPHDRRVDLSHARHNGAPHALSGVAGRGGVGEDHLPRLRIEPVRADHEIVARLRVVVEPSRARCRGRRRSL